MMSPTSLPIGNLIIEKYSGAWVSSTGSRNGQDEGCSY